MSKGEEILIVDGKQRDREGMRRYFDNLGYVCTGVADVAAARELVVEKFFPIALVDLDVAGQGGGLDVARYIRERSPTTCVILLSGRRAFEAAVEALRIGVRDMVVKSPDNVAHLREVVERASDRYVSPGEGEELIQDMRKVLIESFRLLLEQAKTIYTVSTLASTARPRVLLVDGTQRTLQRIAARREKKNARWDLEIERSGGAALERGVSEAFDIVVCRSELADLPGSMVLKSIQAHRGEVLGLLYTREGAGHIARVEHGATEDIERPFGGSRHLFTAIDTLAEEFSLAAEERRYIEAFRNDHPAFVRRFAELKIQLDRLVGE
jgi:DNA-binding NtrC family response regulator